MGEDKRARANRIGNSLDAPNVDDTHWLVSEAIGAWNRVDGLVQEVERLRDVEAALARLARVGDEFSANMAGPHWDELCGALSQARAALRGDTLTEQERAYGLLLSQHLALLRKAS